MEKHTLMRISTRLVTAMAALLCSLTSFSQEYKGPELKPEFVCDLGKITPEHVKVKGATQGFAIWGRYGFVLHDKGQCIVFDVKEKRFVSTFKLKDNVSHCNNACFGVEKGTDFPLLYVSACKGDHCCYVTDITIKSGKIVQKLYFSGEGYTNAYDWFIDRKNKLIYTYGTNGDMSKLIKKFRLPTLEDSDKNSEVHLTQKDVIEEFTVKGIRIYQGSTMKGRYAYLADGYPPHDRVLHVADMKEKKLVKSIDLNGLKYEPEGLTIKGKWLYMAMHIKKQPRDSQIYRFKIK